MKGGFRNPLATNIAPGVVDTIHLADLAVTTAKIDNLAVDTIKLADGAVGSIKIANTLQSDNWDGTTVAARDATEGWRLERDTGDFGANDAVLRGTLIAGDVDRILIDPTSFDVDSVSVDFIINDLPIGRISATASALSIGTLAPFVGAPTSPILIAASEHIKLTAVDHIELQTNEVILDVANTAFAFRQAGASLNARLHFNSDSDTWIGGPASDQIELVAGGNTLISAGVSLGLEADFAAGGRVRSLTVYDTTTGLAANGVVATSGGSEGILARSTSARKYKSRVTYNIDYLADIELKPAKFYRKDDSRWFYGLIADDLAEQDKLLSVFGENDEIEDYDTRELLAVMAAKINRLEDICLT